VLAPYFIAACFSFGTATAKDIQTILITRFFAGLFGSAPVTNTGGVLGDIWAPQQRGTAIVGYAFAVVGGPTLGVSVSALLQYFREIFKDSSRRLVVGGTFLPAATILTANKHC
jgi:MFS family permease